MTDVAATVAATVQLVQLALKVIYTLTITSWRYVPSCTVTNGTSYDFVIIGGGTAGCVLANRLSNSNYSVLLIEAGGYPPLESDMAGVFPTLPSSDYDYNITSVNDNRTCQNLQDGVLEMTAGKMLGGSSCLDHMIHVQGDPHDYNHWAEVLGDECWNYTNNVEYLKKQENLVDAALCNSTYSSLHGTGGPINIIRQMSSDNDNIIAGFVEMGHKYVPDTTSATSTLGITQPLFHIDGNIRQSHSVKYLNAWLGRSNLCVSLDSTVTKILIENSTAYGVKFVDTSSNEYIVYSKKEIILTAGAINSPKILMLSGVGNKTDLEAVGVECLVNSPVGENFQDHPSISLVYTLQSDTSTTAPTNPFKFPVPTTCLYGAINSTQLYPDYQDIMLLFPHASTALVQLCSCSFKYRNDICNQWYAASAGKTTLYVVHNLMIPKSSGKVRLASSNYTDAPLAHTGMYTDKDDYDLTMMAKSLVAFHNVTSTTAFKNMNATLVDLGLCSNTTVGTYDYFKCYVLAMSAGMWHYSGSCAMGKVVDTDLRVMGVSNLSVMDASTFPALVSGNIKAAVTMVAERGAAQMCKNYSITY